MIYANAVVGRTGLGNMLFPWARAVLFCRRSGAFLLAPRWTNFLRAGPWLRRERDKRYYLRSFRDPESVAGLRRLWILARAAHVPEARAEAPPGGRLTVVEFRGMNGRFAPLLGHHDALRARLIASLARGVRERLAAEPGEPFIGVHVRRGDFVNAGIVIGDEWYIRAVARIRADFPGLPVRMFSDAPASALARLAVAAGAEIAASGPAVLDLARLARARALVATSRSTFSMWAAFLGRMPSLWHPSEPPPEMGLGGDARPVVTDGAGGCA